VDAHPDYIPKGQPPKYVGQTLVRFNILEDCQNVISVIGWVTLMTSMVCMLSYFGLMITNNLVNIESLAYWLLATLNLITGCIRIYINKLFVIRLTWMSRIAIIGWSMWFVQASWILLSHHIVIQ